MKYQVMPDLAPDDFEGLRASIKEMGILEPVTVDEDGNILDGHNRAAIGAELGLDIPRRVVSGLSETEKRSYARTVNVARRHLDAAAKRKLIGDELRDDHERSDRAIAKSLGVSDKTVATVRREMEVSAEIPQIAERKVERGGSTFAQKAKVGTATPPEPDAAAATACDDAAPAEPASNVVPLPTRSPQEEDGDLVDRAERAAREDPQPTYSPGTIITLGDRLKIVPSIDEGERQAAAEEARQDALTLRDYDPDSVDDRALAIVGALHSFHHVPITGAEFWEVYGDDTLAKNFLIWADIAQAAIADIKRKAPHALRQKTAKPADHKGSVSAKGDRTVSANRRHRPKGGRAASE